jgi:hypothetical protein
VSAATICARQRPRHYIYARDKTCFRRRTPPIAGSCYLGDAKSGRTGKRATNGTSRTPGSAAGVFTIVRQLERRHWTRTTLARTQSYARWQQQQQHQQQEQLQRSRASLAERRPDRWAIPVRPRAPVCLPVAFTRAPCTQRTKLIRGLIME